MVMLWIALSPFFWFPTVLVVVLTPAAVDLGVRHWMSRRKVGTSAGRGLHRLSNPSHHRCAR
jgi:hypothetical protein